MVAFALMGILFMSELYDYLSPNISEDLLVDTTRGSKLRINIDFVFPSIPCESSLECILLVQQHINIQQICIKGEIGHGNKKFLDAVLPNATSTIKPECESCYGAEYGDVNS
ncbi:Endoplasmic reticulum-Golgi intermediate compartment protein 3 [Armadillidium vulgare]|nr:Endoplasmic reticulum-Golgi intermediate compartment protein 3 [Armadillidium vulgare]